MRARLRLRRFVPQERPAGLSVLLRVGALAFVAAALVVAVMQLRRSEIDAPPPMAIAADPLAADLIRCRAITPEQFAIDDTCRRVWAENRRRFFAPSSSRPDTKIHDPVASAPATPGKGQDRLPAVGVQSDRDGVR
ncbi:MULTISPECIES: putative entry exclusion protein TrbK-alt [unclassified Afipia]|uniref:putative entry exclusion protein TrbK-alt n=1 Tax=unclassified Afipia TaxID=2642050 RepID=UPI0003FC9E3D|nr:MULTISPECIES: putative entry exclusion protein TrbK-alt [unclassified Afipia]